MCSLQCDAARLGDLYSVLSRRSGEVAGEDVIEGSQLFLLDALLPVVESFGFASELLKKTSGVGTAPQLEFSHWQLLSEDPFWRPLTEEEREETGELAYEESWCRSLVNAARRRKGLPAQDKIVANAEKQRTLKR
jgi:ribosome assembly protein 1